MSTEVARFENKKEGRSLFLRYCGTPEQQAESGSARRSRLQVSLPRNTMCFTYEQAQELARELTELFPSQQDGEGGNEPSVPPLFGDDPDGQNHAAS